MSNEKQPRRRPLTPEEFVLKAIETLRQPPYKGIHSVFSGFNAAFREYFPGLDPVEVTNGLAEEGKLVIRPVRRGVMLYRPEDAPAGSRDPKALLKQMGLNE